jgi:hypothetical protein
MTFKPLDLQMSVPRTQEYSGMHQQAAQRPVTEQSMLANQSSKQTEELRHQNAALEQSSKLDVRANQEQSGGKAYKRKSRKPRPDSSAGTDTDPEQPVHPYKGHHFDMKL